MSYTQSGNPQEFKVEIVAPDNLKEVWKYGQEVTTRLVLSIDGKCVRYGHSVKAGQKVVFDGFLPARETVKASFYQTAETKAVYQAFKFASTLVQLPCPASRCV